MNIFKSILAVSVLSFIAISCGNSTNNAAKDVKDTEVTDEHHHNESLEVIELNNGEKWEVNAEMKPYVLKGQEIVTAYIQSNRTDFTKLAEEVAEQNDHLIQSCTMQGKSHDELHKWLHPHLELVEELSTAPDSEKAKELIAKLEKSYQQYAIYFK